MARKIVKIMNTHPSVMKVSIKAKRVPISDVPDKVKEVIQKKVKGSNPFADELRTMLSKGGEKNGK